MVKPNIDSSRLLESTRFCFRFGHAPAKLQQVEAGIRAQEREEYDALERRIWSAEVDQVGSMEELRASLSGPLFQYAAFLLSLRMKDSSEARRTALAVLRSRPELEERLRSIAAEEAPELINRAASILEAEARVKLVKGQRDKVSDRVVLERLREIVEQEPLCYVAQKEHQRACEGLRALNTALAFYDQARQLAEPWALLGAATARVAASCYDLSRCLNLLLENISTPRTIALSQTVLQKQLANHPEWLAPTRRFLESRLEENESEALRALLSTARDVRPEQSSPTSLRPADILGRVSKLSRNKVAALARAPVQATSLPQVFEQLLALVRVGAMDQAKNAERHLRVLDESGGIYSRIAEQALKRGSLKAVDWLDMRYSGDGRLSGSPSGTRANPLVDNARLVLRGDGHVRSVPLHRILNVYAEKQLAQLVIQESRDMVRRARGVTALAAMRIGSMLRDFRKNPDFATKHTYVYTHLLVGNASLSKNWEQDAVMELLARASAGSVAEAMANNFRVGHGPHIWDAVWRLGNFGYRLRDSPQLFRGGVQLRLEQCDPEKTDLSPLLHFFGAYTDEVESLESLRTRLAELSREKKLGATLVAVYIGDASLRLQKYISETGPYGAECVQLEGQSEATLQKSLVRARALIGTIENPVAAFPFQGQKLRDEQLVLRPQLVLELESALYAEERPLAIHCMRKSGKTATARLLALGGPQTFVDLRRPPAPLRKDPYGLLAALRALVPEAPDRRSLLVLDEYDFFMRQLASQPEGVAMEFMEWLVDAAQSARVLCLGLDPDALRTLYPASNPLQALRTFCLPYLSPEERISLIHRMAGALQIDDDLARRLDVESGGHPGVLRGLMMWCIEGRFGTRVTRIPTSSSLRLADIPFEDLRSEVGFAKRRQVLSTILDTMGQATGIVKDAWSLMEHLVVQEACPSGHAVLLERALQLDLGLTEHPSVVLELLLDWGLVAEIKPGFVTTSIPLLRYHLRSMQRLGPDDASMVS